VFAQPSGDEAVAEDELEVVPQRGAAVGNVEEVGGVGIFGD
jgi:hypothetical protein